MIHTARAERPIGLILGILLLMGIVALPLFAQPASTIDLADDGVDFKVIARDGEDRLGSAHAIATGDFNNDGTTDFLLGMPGGDGPNDRRQNAGEAFIIFGAPDLPPTFNADGIPGPDVIIYGRDQGDRLGTSVTSGDVNGDGIDDVILSASDGDGPANSRSDVGEVTVLNGRRSWSDRIDLNNEDPDLFVYNNRQLSSFGESMATVDVNGDAIKDLVIGDPGARGEAGIVYVIHGRRDLPDRLDIARAADVNVTIRGADPGDRLGQSVGGGFLNEDNIEDLVVAAPFADGAQNSRPDAGTAFIVLGREDLPSLIDLGQTSPNATIEGAARQNRLGTGLAIADLNGDGFDDIAVGAPGAGGPNSQQGSAGMVHVINGAQSLQPLYDMQDPDAADVRINGSQALENAGEAIALSDLDQDGQLDILIGAPAGGGPQGGGGRAEAGTVYVVRNDNGFPSQLGLGSGADLVVYGANGGDMLGTGLDAGAVTNGNEGVILMGAPGVDSQVNGPNAGTVYLLRASDLIQPNRPPQASAGPDQSVPVGANVQLDGSGSSDPEGGPLSFSWTFTSRPSGSGAQLSGANTAQPTFTADVAGDYVIQMTVEDDRGDTATDQVRVTAQENQAPTANAGPDRSVQTGSDVQLDGSGSSDPEGGQLSFSWSFSSRPSESDAQLSGANSPNPTFTADVAGDYVVQLTVTDPEGATDTDEVRITAGAGDTDGDVDDDGDVDIIDARLVCEAVLGDRELSEAERERADVNGDGEITLDDAQWIAEAAVGKRTLGTSNGANSQADTARSMQLLSVNVLRTEHQDWIVRATGLGIDAVRLDVFNLAGHAAYRSDWTDGPRLAWRGLTDGTQRLANGVYLAAVSVRGVDGSLHREIHKIVLLR